MIFSDIVGNEKNKELLKNIINTNNIAHSYMFIGKDSIGKLLFAKEFAKALLCVSQKKPCNECKSCIQFDTYNNPDFTIIEPESGSIKIDQIRELTKKVYEKPVVASRKVYIINNSNYMTTEAQNSLLKTLEEPPEYVTIILIASEENQFLPTIKSRCTKISFNKLTNLELKKILEEKYNHLNIPEIIFKIADGSVKKAINLKDNENDYKKLDKLFGNLENSDIIDLMQAKEEIFKNKEEIDDVLSYINLIFFNKIKLNNIYIECMKIVEDTKDRLNKNNNFDMTIDNFIMTVWEEINGKYYRSKI